MSERQHVVVTVDAASVGQPAVALLAAASGLSKMRIKDAMAKGAVWLINRSGQHRLRRVTQSVQLGEKLELFYDPAVLALQPEPAGLVADCRDYSVWFKPAGMLSQGSPYGDHCSLDTWVTKYYSGSRKVHLLHRLDREASGLVILAHTKPAAAGLSKLLAEGGMDKSYRVLAHGLLGQPGEKISIDLPLDGKVCGTDVSVLCHTAEGNSLLDVSLRTGRKHQIRRHLEAIGHPVMGEPRYGRDNAWKAGLQLRAWRMGFVCPLARKPQLFVISAE